jgi:hypothetical protein
MTALGDLNLSMMAVGLSTIRCNYALPGELKPSGVAMDDFYCMSMLKAQKLTGLDHSYHLIGTYALSEAGMGCYIQTSSQDTCPIWDSIIING